MPTPFKVLLIALQYLLPLAVFSQTSISGTVTNVEGEPIPFATIIAQGSSVGASTDEQGNFNLTNLPDSKVTLITRAVGYQTKKQSFDNLSGPK